MKRVLTDWSLKMPGLYLYYSNRRLVQPALRAFIDCLLDRDGEVTVREISSGCDDGKECIVAMRRGVYGLFIANLNRVSRDVSFGLSPRVHRTGDAGDEG